MNKVISASSMSSCLNVNAFYEGDFISRFLLSFLREDSLATYKGLLIQFGMQTNLTMLMVLGLVTIVRKLSGGRSGHNCQSLTKLVKAR